uniref:MYND-type domain-containing protein n=1 Tax=Heterosigma akashiwo TaxID=2829 RepID=A0A6V1SJX1_HETAK
MDAEPTGGKEKFKDKCPRDEAGGNSGEEQKADVVCCGHHDQGLANGAAFVYDQPLFDPAARYVKSAEEYSRLMTMVGAMTRWVPEEAWASNGYTLMDCVGIMGDLGAFPCRVQDRESRVVAAMHQLQLQRDQALVQRDQALERIRVLEAQLAAAKGGQPSSYTEAVMMDRKRVEGAGPNQGSQGQQAQSGAAGIHRPRFAARKPRVERKLLRVPFGDRNPYELRQMIEGFTLEGALMTITGCKDAWEVGFQSEEHRRSAWEKLKEANIEAVQLELAIDSGHHKVAAIIKQAGSQQAALTACKVCNTNTTLRCQRCKKAAFCSEACQKNGWRAHKKTCRSVVACK